MKLEKDGYVFLLVKSKYSCFQFYSELEYRLLSFWLLHSLVFFLLRLSQNVLQISSTASKKHNLVNINAEVHCLPSRYRILLLDLTKEMKDPFTIYVNFILIFSH